MKGYRFYEEFINKRKGISRGTVVAALLDDNQQPIYFMSGGCYMVEAIAGVIDAPNSPVCSTSASYDYLREDCKRVSEKRAREVHPVLFEYLDQP